MKAALFYAMSDAPMDKVMAIFPRHKAQLDAYHARGELLAVGAFADPKQDGAMGIFKSREFAEAFVKTDPFVLEGIVMKVVIKDWNEIFLG